MPFWCYMHMQLFGKKGHLTTRGSPIKYGDQIHRLLETVHLPTEASISHCKGHRKGALKWHEGTKQLTRQLIAVLQNHGLIGVATLVPQTNVPETSSYTEGETLKAKVRAFKNIIWGGSKRRDSFFCLGTSSGSWLTPYMPLLI